MISDYGTGAAFGSVGSDAGGQPDFCAGFRMQFHRRGRVRVGSLSRHAPRFLESLGAHVNLLCIIIFDTEAMFIPFSDLKASELSTEEFWVHAVKTCTGCFECF
jgi:hypothetical protein